MNSLALNLIIREKIKTTEPKAKELKPFIEKLVTKAKKGDLATRKIVISKLSNRKKEVKKLKDLNYDAYFDKTQVKGKDFYRVRVGPLASKDKALQMLDEIQQNPRYEESFVTQE